MISLASSQYTKTLKINDNNFLVNFSKDYIIKEILDLQEISKGKNMLEMKEIYIKSLRVILGNGCIDKIYAGDEPQAKTLQDCINYIIKEWGLLNLNNYGEDFKEVNEAIKKYENISRF